MPDAMIAKLEAVLTKEKAALLSGDFSAIDRLAPDKKSLFSKLAAHQPDASALQRIAAQLNENQKHFAAAIEGVASARARLLALQHVQETLSVYDHSGRVDLVQNHHPAVEKKA